MISAEAFLAQPLPFGKICSIYPPLVKDVVGLENFNLYRQLLTTSAEELEDRAIEYELKQNPISKLENLDLITPLQYILSLTLNNPTMAKIVKEAFKFFIHEEVHLVPSSQIILIGNLDDLVKLEDLTKARQLNSENFFEFQNCLRVALGEKHKEPPEPNMHPRLRKMKYMARYRDKIKAKKNGVQLGTLLSSICCMGIGLTPLNIGEISYAAFNGLLLIHGQKELYEQNISTLLAGGDSNKIKPKYWISDPENDE